MIPLIIRLVLFGAVIFGVFYGVSKAVTSWRLKNKGAIRGIQKELRALQAGRAQGVYTDAEYDRLTQEIYNKCEAAGIEVPHAD